MHTHCFSQCLYSELPLPAAAVPAALRSSSRHAQPIAACWAQPQTARLGECCCCCCAPCCLLINKTSVAHALDAKRRIASRLDCCTGWRTEPGSSRSPKDASRRGFSLATAAAALSAKADPVRQKARRADRSTASRRPSPRGLPSAPRRRRARAAAPWRRAGGSGGGARAAAAVVKAAPPRPGRQWGGDRARLRIAEPAAAPAALPPGSEPSFSRPPEPRLSPARPDDELSAAQALGQQLHRQPAQWLHDGPAAAGPAAAAAAAALGLLGARLGLPGRGASAAAAVGAPPAAAAAAAAVCGQQLLQLPVQRREADGGLGRVGGPHLRVVGRWQKVQAAAGRRRAAHGLVGAPGLALPSLPRPSRPRSPSPAAGSLGAVRGGRGCPQPGWKTEPGPEPRSRQGPEPRPSACSIKLVCRTETACHVFSEINTACERGGREFVLDAVALRALIHIGELVFVLGSPLLRCVLGRRSFGRSAASPQLCLSSVRACGD